MTGRASATRFAPHDRRRAREAGFFDLRLVAPIEPGSPREALSSRAAGA